MQGFCDDTNNGGLGEEREKKKKERLTVATVADEGVAVVSGGSDMTGRQCPGRSGVKIKKTHFFSSFDS